MQLRISLHSASDYTTARALHDEIEPIPERFKNGGLRPLAKDRQAPDKYSIRLEHPPTPGSKPEVRMRYHDTDVVIWHPDDSVTLDFGGWKSFSTCTFITETTPASARLSHETVLLTVPGQPVRAMADAVSTLRFRIGADAFGDDVWATTKPHLTGVLIGPGRKTLPRFRRSAAFVRAWQSERKHLRPFYSAQAWQSKFQDWAISPSLEQRAEPLDAALQRLIAENDWVPGAVFPRQLLRYAPPDTTVFRLETKPSHRTNPKTEAITRHEAEAMIREGILTNDLINVV